MKISSNWARVMASQRTAVGRCRTFRPTGWRGGYKRKPPQGEHKCLPRTEMVALIASMK